MPLRFMFTPLQPWIYYLNPKILQTVAPPVRPMAPTQQVAAQPAPAPVAPPPTVQTVDIYFQCTRY